MTTNIEIRHAPPADLKPNPWNSNVVGPEMERRLDESLRKFGVYKPIIVRELEDGSLQILGGEHRCRAAQRAKLATVPYVNLGRMDDVRAKQIGLADNGRYGEDDALKLARVLQDIGDVEDITSFLPYNDKDLAGLFAADEIDLDSIGIDDDKDDGKTDTLPEIAARATITHTLMRFKVPVEQQGAVEAFITRISKARGYDREKDAMVGAGMALVDAINAAGEIL